MIIWCFEPSFSLCHFIIFSSHNLTQHIVTCFEENQWSCASKIGPRLRSQQTPIYSQRQVVRSGCGARVLQIQCNYCTCSLSWSNVTKPADNVIKLVGIRKTASFVAHRFFFCMLYNQMYIHAAYYIFSYLAKRLWVWWGMKPWLEDDTISCAPKIEGVRSIDWYVQHCQP